MEGTPWGDKPSGVTPKGDEVWGGDGPGWTVDEKSSATKVAANAVPDQRTSPEYGRPDSAAQPGTQANGAAAETSDNHCTIHNNQPKAEGWVQRDQFQLGSKYICVYCLARSHTPLVGDNINKINILQTTTLALYQCKVKYLI